MSMKGNSSEVEPRTSSSFEKVARNWFDSFSLMRLFRSRDTVWTRLFIEYIELAYDIEYCDVRAPDIRVPPSMELALGAFQALFSV